MRFSERLEQMGACTEAVEWVGRKGIRKSWETCERGDWMLWLAGRIDIDRKLLMLCACDCAERGLKYVPEGEDRPAEAIRITRLWVDGKATIQDMHEGRNAAKAAEWAAEAAAAEWAAAAAEWAAAERKAKADIIRKHIPVDMIEKAWKERIA